MANLNAPFGFRPIRHMSALGHTANQYTIASGYAYDIARGDIVKSDGNGGIAKCAAGETPLGVFLGYNVDSTNQGSLTDLIPFYKHWAAGTVIASGRRVVALVADDPGETLEVMAAGSITAADIGAFVDLVDASIETVFSKSQQTVGNTAAGKPVASVTVGTAGSSYETAPTVTFSAPDQPGGTTATGTAVLGVDGAANTVASVTIVSGGSGYTVAPTVTFTGGGGSGAVGTAVLGTAVAKTQFRIERILEKAVRQTNAAGNDTVGYGLTGTGSYALVEVKYAKHERGGSSLAVAV